MWEQRLLLPRCAPHPSPLSSGLASASPALPWGQTAASPAWAGAAGTVTSLCSSAGPGELPKAPDEAVPMSQGCSRSPAWQSIAAVPRAAQGLCSRVELCHAGESQHCCCTGAVGVCSPGAVSRWQGQAAACSVLCEPCYSHLERASCGTGESAL